MNIAVYTLTSALHDPQALDVLTKEFLTSLNVPYILKGDDFSDYGSHDLDLIFVRTGGTEGLFQQLMPALAGKSEAPFYLAHPATGSDGIGCQKVAPLPIRGHWETVRLAHSQPRRCGMRPTEIRR